MRAPVKNRLLTRRRVYDPVLRVIHAWNGLAMLLLLVSGLVVPHMDPSPGRAVLWQAHIWLGYGMLLGFSARLAWGLAGPAHARWSSMWHPQAWIDAWRHRSAFTVPVAFGHHPLASAVYLVVYFLLAIMLASGLALAAIVQNSGPLYPWLGHDVALKSLFHTPHTSLQYPLWLFLMTHLAALVSHEHRHGVPLAQAMVSGYQYLEVKP